MRRDRHIAVEGLIIPAAALLATLPLLLSGPSCGHDFDFHLLSWLEASTQLSHGAFPHWAFTPGWNAGEPRFLFYPPLSWLLGALLGLALPWTLVPAALTFITLTLAGLSMRALAGRFVDPTRATLAAVLYLANPYMLFTAYERTAYGELLAAAIIPLLFAAILAPTPRLLRIALPVALIWLSNAPAGVMCCYALALLTLLRLVLERNSPLRDRLRRTGSVAGGTALGLALAAAYLLPAAFEQPLISPQLAVVEGMRIQDNMPFHPMTATAQTSAGDAALHNAVLAQASWIWVELLIGIAAALLLVLYTRRRTPAPPTRLLTPALLLFLAAMTLLLTPLSLPLWLHLPELRFLQFPWRLLALIAPVCALLLARAIPPFRPRPAALLLLLLAPAALIAQAWHNDHQPCDDEDAVPARVALFHSPLGTDQTDEYTPAGADEDALQPGNPPWWLAPGVNAPPPAGSRPGQAPRDLTLTLPAPAWLILNRRLYPVWQVRLNGQPVILDQARPDGLISLPLPAGPDHIELTERRTPDEDAGLVITLLAATLSLTLWRRARHAP